jgi:hypothetical protein
MSPLKHDRRVSLEMQLNFSSSTSASSFFISHKKNFHAERNEKFWMKGDQLSLKLLLSALSDEGGSLLFSFAARNAIKFLSSLRKTVWIKKFYSSLLKFDELWFGRFGFSAALKSLKNLFKSFFFAFFMVL